DMASRAQVTLAMEIMDYPLMNSISKALGYAHYLNNPWFQLYPDIGNLSAWDNDVQMELQAGIGHIVAVHVKDTKPGGFKNVPFCGSVVDFERCFEKLKQSGSCLSLLHISQPTRLPSIFYSALCLEKKKTTSMPASP
ncbi:TIM barrel protein, partial [Salmonella enterica]|uniref:TIM barrel protein n=1 Tax=Salmonella enterica TaxID=28901 RepID=UPI00214B2E71